MLNNVFNQSSPFLEIAAIIVIICKKIFLKKNWPVAFNAR